MTEHEELEMWKSMYLRLLQSTEDAVNLLIRAEQATEDLYIEAGLSKAQYAADTRDTKHWIPIMAMGDPEEISFARAFRLSTEDVAEAARRAAENAEEDGAKQNPNS